MLASPTTAQDRNSLLFKPLDSNGYIDEITSYRLPSNLPAGKILTADEFRHITTAVTANAKTIGYHIVPVSKYENFQSAAGQFRIHPDMVQLARKSFSDLRYDLFSPNCMQSFPLENGEHIVWLRFEESPPLRKGEQTPNYNRMLYIWLHELGHALGPYTKDEDRTALSKGPFRSAMENFVLGNRSENEADVFADKTFLNLTGDFETVQAMVLMRITNSQAQFSTITRWPTELTARRSFLYMKEHAEQPSAPIPPEDLNLAQAIQETHAFLEARPIREDNLLEELAYLRRHQALMTMRNYCRKVLTIHSSRCQQLVYRRDDLFVVHTDPKTFATVVDKKPSVSSR